MPGNFSIKIEGMEKLRLTFLRFPKEFQKSLRAAGKEASTKIILSTIGLKKYPPATAANRPPAPFYIRGVGTQTGRGKRTAKYGNMTIHLHNTLTSEKLGTQWYTKAAEWGGTEIGNRASYARWVHGEEQASAMAAIGWRRLVDVAKEKTKDILQIYSKWIDYTLKTVKLK